KNHIHNLKNELDNLFNKLNKEYNGLLFHRHKLLENIKIDDNVLKYIINKLYFPESPYNFKHIHVEILGRIFEQYLGNTITIKDGEVSIEIKEELKKAGGVYYTPEEIVEKIVNETISKDLSNITKKKLTNYKAIDITCGSGSFLIKIYKKIINHYEELYSSKKEYLKEAIENDMVFLDNNVINLTLKHKKKILENNIFGVDIDPQAVELTKMSLYITMLENTCKDKTTRPILPSLSDNIKCGNSIVSTDYYIGYEEYQESLDLQVRPFNWEQEFWKKGFNCIVGNPPYVRIQLLKDIYPESMTEYIKDKYDSAKHGNFDLSVVFVEKAIQLLNNKGRLGYIVLNKFFNTKYGLGLRKILSDGRTKYLDKILDFKDQQVFKGVTTYTCLLFLKREKTNNFSYAKVEDIDSWFLNRNANYEEKKYDKIGKKPWYFGNNQHQELKENLKDNTMKLSSIAKRIFVGVQTNCDEVFLLKKINKDGNIVYCESSYTGKVHPFEVDHIKKVLKGSDDIRKYKHSNNKRLIFPYDLGTSRPPVIEEQDYKDRHPLTWEYLNICKKRLKDRTEVKNGEINSWYEYRYRKNHSRFEQPKILLPSLCKGSRFSLDKNGEFYFTGSGQGGGGGYGLVLKENTVYNYYSLLGVMNSKVISYFIIHDGTPQSGGYQGIRKSFIEELLIPIINGDEVKKELLSEIGTKAKLLFNLNKNKISKTEGEKRLKMLNDTYNNEIDNLVYQLYELNEEEIKHIEEFMQ
ncbi:MAG: Eco57I restriction-modification methylase domain-containing protein, partial [Candidatus Woesearchaeota archaeon]